MSSTRPHMNADDSITLFAGQGSTSPPPEVDDIADSLGEVRCPLPLPQDSLSQRLQRRYGFSWWPSQGAEYQKLPSNTLTWEKTRIILADVISPVEEEHKDPIRDFVYLLLGGHSPSGLLWDLSERNARPLRKRGCKLEVATFTQHLSSATSSGHAKPTTDTLVRYALQPSTPTQERCKWVLVVDRAATVLECMRLDFTERDKMAMYFINRGIPFSTKVSCPVSNRKPCRVPFRGIGLGWRPRDYVANAVDYAAYEDARDTFFRQPRARVALMRGGIIWRLAIEHIGPESILVGPTDGVFDNGDVWRPLGPMEFWDDSLTDEEIDLICGVYKVDTGKMLFKCTLYCNVLTSVLRSC
jgi:hypothetical protein